MKRYDFIDNGESDYGMAVRECGEYVKAEVAERLYEGLRRTLSYIPDTYVHDVERRRAVRAALDFADNN